LTDELKKTVVDLLLDVVVIVVAVVGVVVVVNVFIVNNCSNV